MPRKRADPNEPKLNRRFFGEERDYLESQESTFQEYSKTGQLQEFWRVLNVGFWQRFPPAESYARHQAMQQLKEQKQAKKFIPTTAKAKELAATVTQPAPQPLLEGMYMI